MKSTPLFLGAALNLLLLGCSSLPVALAPVGPNPARPASTTATGKLEVFSSLEEQRDGNEFDVNPAWYQHTDYTVCDLADKRVRHVFNTVGHYAQAPSVVILPPGNYLVKAEAQGFLQVDVPVVIEPGRTTRVHLDARWNPPAEASKTKLVSLPNGYAVGWKAGPGSNVRMHSPG